MIVAMTLWELISSAQQRYVGAYRQLLRQQRPRVPGLAAELTMRTDMPAHVPIDYRVLRVDLLWREPAPTGQAAAPAQTADGSATPVDPMGEPRVAAVALNPAPPLPVPLRTEYPDGQVVIVHALPWDDCPFSVSAATQAASAAGSGAAGLVELASTLDEPLLAWLRRWRDRTDSPGVEPDADGLYSAVHSMTPPQFGSAAITFTVDFGSAPPEAFTSLISTLLANGVRSIQVGEGAPAGVVNLV